MKTPLAFFKKLFFICSLLFFSNQLSAQDQTIVVQDNYVNTNSYSEGLYRITSTPANMDISSQIYTYSNLTLSLKLIAGGNFKLASIDFPNLTGTGVTIRIQAKKSGSNFGTAIIASATGTTNGTSAFENIDEVVISYASGTNGVQIDNINLDNPVLPLSIASFTPTSGAIGTSVTITGTSFNTTTTNNIVFFGATKATVSAATTTSLTVSVPAGATYGPLTLVDLSINKTISSKKFFTPTYSPIKGILTSADFSTEQSFSTGTTEPNKIAATGDLDGDGKPDIIIADDAGKKTLILRNTGGNGTASFETALTITTSGNQTSLNVGDIDGDGKLDLVEVDKTNSSFVSVYLNTTVSVGSISFSAATNLITGANNHKLRNVAISDLDGDSKADIAVVNNDGNVLLYRNTGSVGTVSFAAKVEYAAGTGPQGIMIGDIDSDGLPDLAITNADGGGTSVRVLRNTSTSGTLSFVNSGNFTTGGGPYDLALGDLDGDGELDIATVNHGGQNVSVLLNTSTSGTVSFANKTDFAIGKSALKIAIGDLNGDGKLDVVVTQGGAAVSILTNTTTTAGTVTFAPKIDALSTGTSLQAIIGDLDGDGKTDFATGGSKKIIVFHNADPLENADLEALSISGDGTLSPTFTPSTTVYTAIVSNAITSITVTPTQTTSNATATIQVRVNAGSYVAVASASASDPLDLIVGSNTIDVKVTSPDGNTIKNYAITVTREMPVPSYIVSGAGTAAVNGVYVHIGKNNSGKLVWQFGSYYLTSDNSQAWIGTDPNYSWSGVQYSVWSSATDPTQWNMSRSSGADPAPIIELAAPKVSYASSTLIENSADDGSISGVTTITHNNYTGATFTGTDGEDFVTSGKALVTGVPTGLTAVIIRNNNLQLTFSLTGNASAHANDISNLNITFQNSAFSDSDAANTINYDTNLSINFIEHINVGSGQTYTTIQSAVNASGNGDVLLLAAETFTEQNITITNKSLTIIGVSPASTIVQAHAVAGSATDRVFNITHSSYAETNFNSFEKLTIRHGNVANSNGNDRGGALFVYHTTLKLKDCAIESNRVGTTGWGGYGVGGAGVYVQISNFISENCTYYDNHHTSESRTDLMGGGAIAFFPDDQVNYMEISNCTFSGNSSGAHGGAIMNRPTITNDIRITNSTFVGNSAPYGGAYMQMGSSANPQPIFLINSLFYGNTASLGGAQLYSDQATNWTVDNCLMEDTSAGGLAGVFTDCIVGVDPLLGALADNGSFTKTYSIGLGSPAINSGTTTSLLLDQRGFTILGARDIGSYEYGGAIPLSANADLSDLSSTAGTLDPIFTSGTTAYTTAVVSNATTSFTVTPTQSDANATIEVQVNGDGFATVTTGTASGALSLNTGSNTVDVKVTAQNGSTVKTYTTTIVRNILPVFTSAATVNFAENGTGTAYTVAATDANAVTYSFGTGNDETLFSITAGEVTFKASPDFEVPVGNNADNTYVINVIANDGVNTVNQNVTITVTDVAEDVTSPTFESALTASNVQDLYFALDLDLDESGTVYYVILADGAYTPTSAEVKAGTASGGTASLFSGNKVLSESPSFSAIIDIAVLTPSTSYDVYAVAEDVNSNLQATPSKVDVTTEAISPNFRWTTATRPSAGTVEETVNGVTATLTSSGTNADFGTAGNQFGTTYNLGSVNAPVANMTVSFSSAVNLTSIRVVNFSTKDWVLSPIGGSNAIVNSAAPPSPGSEVVSLNWIGVTGFVVTESLGDMVNFIIDDIVVNPNSAPVVDLNGATAGLNTIGTFTENGSTLIADVGTITDADNDNILSMTVTVTGYTGTIADQYLGINGATNTIASNAGVTVGTYDANTGIMSFTGSATAATYTSILRGIAYINDSENPPAGDVTIHIEVNDGTVESNDATNVITITPVNDPSVFTSVTSTNFAENGTGTAYTITATDVESTNFTYTLGTGNDEDKFNITGNLVTFKTSPDFENPTDGGASNTYVIKVEVSENGLTVNQNVTITVTDVDDTAPEFTSPTAVDFAENGTGTAYTIIATDANAITYSLGTGNDEASFNISAGVVTFKAAPDFESPADGDTDNDYVIDVIATDGAGNATTLVVTITVTDVFEGSEWLGTTSSDWTVASNWDGGVPDGTTDVLIPATITDPIISGTASVDDLEIQTGATVTVNSGGALAIMGSVTGDGDAIIKRNTNTNKGYSLIGSPITDATIAGLAADYIYDFDGTNYFVPTGIMTPGKGYFAAFNDPAPEVVFTGTPNTGTINKSVALGGDNFNIVANPYAAAISRANFIAANGPSAIDGNIWLWDDGGSNVGGNRGGDYIAVNNVGSTSTIELGDGIAGTETVSAFNGNIGSVQGFLVLATADADITFTPTMQSTTAGVNDDANHFRTGDLQKMRISLSGNGLYSDILVALADGATEGKDYGLDAEKFAGNDLMSFYSQQGDKHYAIQTLPHVASEDRKVALGMELGESATYTLEVQDMENMEGLTVYLNDKQTGEKTLLANGNTYSFGVKTGSITDRFSLTFSNSVLGNEELSSELKVLKRASEVVIYYPSNNEEKVSIYTLSGQLVYEANLLFKSGEGVLKVQIDMDHPYVLRVNNEVVKFILK